ncbi:hypothetical protein GCM10028798_35120 [Humibacter antri]
MSTQTLDQQRASTTEAIASLRRNSHPPSPMDRLAMRVGLALVLWSRREHRARRSRDAEWALAVQRNRLERERREREATWLVAMHKLPPR